MADLLIAGGEFAADDQRYLDSQTPNEHPDIAQLASGGFAAAWIANGVVRVQMFDADGLPLGEIIVIGTSGKYNPSVTGLSSGGFVVTWEGTSDASGLGIWAQRFDASGNLVGSQFQLNSTTFAHQQQPDVVALQGGGFVASWTDQYGDGTNAGIVARIFDASGMPVTGELHINVTNIGDQYYSKLTALPDGGFVVTWQQPGLLARIYNADGTPRSGEISVGSTSFVHELTALANGNVVIAWSEDSGYPNTEIKARIYEPDGDPVGAAFAVNTPTQLREMFPTIAPLDAGGFVIAWKSDTAGINYSQQGDIYAQVFDQSGAKVGTEFLVNQNTDLGQDDAQAVAFGSGDFAVLWRDFAGNKIAIRNFYSATTLTDDADNFVGTDGRDFVFGLDGVDQLAGGSGNDYLDGGAGNDLIAGGAGDDVISIAYGDSADGGDGTDTLNISFAARTERIEFYTSSILAGASLELGDGLIENMERVGRIEGTAYADYINVADQPGAVTIDAGGGNDVVFTFGTPVNFTGGDGRDFLASGSAADVFDGGSGEDTIDYRHAAAGVTVTLSMNAGGVGSSSDGDRIRNVEIVGGSFFNDVLLGSNQGDILDGGAGNDILFGNGGDDKLWGGSGDDSMYGGAGDDEYRVSEPGDQVLEAAGEGFDWLFPNFSYTLPNGVHVERIVLIGDPTAPLSLTGNDLANALIGNDGANVINGKEGNDVLEGWGGNDLLIAGSGTDNLYGLDGDDGMYVGGWLTAGDVFHGGAGNDQLGLQGNYSGGFAFGSGQLTSVETIVLLPGNDTRFGDTAGNFYDYALATADGNVTAGSLLTVNFNSLRAGEDVVFDGSAETNGSFLTYGGAGNDFVVGGRQADGFFFGDGRWNPGDKLNGQLGSDQMALQGDYSGGVAFGADQLTSIETIVLLTGSDSRFGGGAAVFSYALTMHDGNVGAGDTMTINANTLKAAEVLTFNGSAETDGAFRVFSGASNDTIAGGAGADQLYGAAGADVLTGGAGNDVFGYISAAHSVQGAADAITDFTLGEVIDLSAIDADASTAGNDAFTFIGAGAFTNVAGQLRVEDQGSGVWLVQGDVDGDGTADLWITVNFTGGPAHQPGAADFVL